MSYAVFDTALGVCGIAWSDRGITAFRLPEATPEATEEHMARRTGVAAAPPPPWVAAAIARVKSHLDGTTQDFSDLPLDLTAVSPFLASVYRALHRVPPGTMVTYGDLARRVGSEGGARAVGRAMAANPIALIVPCHRVRAAGGAGGFSAHGGLVTKDRLLDLERAHEPLFAAVGRLPYDAAAARRHLAGADKLLAAHIVKIGDFALRIKEAEGTFAALAESIVHQQLNGKAAATIFDRVRALFPRGRLEPRVLLALSDDALRGAGLSRSKLAALRDLGARTEAGEVPTLTELGRMDDEAIVKKLTPIRGIGRWTVEMLLIFRLGRPDVLPVDDYGIKKGFARLFHRGSRRDELPEADSLLRRGERWRPFRSAASWYLWRAAELPD